MKINIRLLLALGTILLWILLFYLQFERPFLAVIIQNISPSLWLSTLSHTLFWLAWISAPLFIFAIFKGKYFCHRICPLGLIQGVLPSWGRVKHSRINLYFFLLALPVSFLATNLLALLDPLVIFNRAVISLKIRLSELLIFFFPLFLIILLTLYKKKFWCFKLCPLGALIDWLIILKKRKKFSSGKRRTLITLGSGFILGFLLKTKNLFPGPNNSNIIRPPGALPEREFKNRCIRCGSCIAACPTKTLTPVLLASGLDGIFTPQLVPAVGPCSYNCNNCGQTCPVQAIKKLPLERKRKCKIGTAVINRSLCPAWYTEQPCLICADKCPYGAITLIRNENGLSCPLVVPEVCHGCGYCEYYCPVLPLKAITVSNKNSSTSIK